MLSESIDDPPRLLLVSERAAELMRLRRALGESGFQIEDCTSRGPFLLAIENRTCDVALIDANTPGMLAWCAAVPRSSRGSFVPLIAMTPTDGIEEALRAGVSDVISGDETPQLLGHRMHSALQNSELHTALSVGRTALDRTQALTRTGSFEFLLEEEGLVCSTETCRILGLEPDRPGYWRVDELLPKVKESSRNALAAWFERARVELNIAPLECALVQPSPGPSHARFVSAGPERRIGCLPRISGLVQDISETSPAEGDTSNGKVAVGGLLDAADFVQRVARMIARAQSPQDQVAVLFVHVDLERALYLAPEIAPLIFSTVVQRLRDCIRDRDTLGSTAARVHDISLGQIGDAEFGVLLPGLVRIHDAYKVARRIQESLSLSIAHGSEELWLENSIGIALCPHDSTHAEALIQSAASAEKGARAEDKSSIRFFTPSMNASAFERLTLETSLRRAIERRELCLHYQPKIEIATGKVVGFEALARWNHPELGLVSPGQFIPIAEETGLIIPLGEYVLREALSESRRWQDQGLPQVRMAVNLSGVQFRDPHLAAAVAESLESTGIPADMLELELTESILLQKADAILSKLGHLKKMGVHLSIDDFGTGYSSLSYLKRFPIDSLKIDQSFIREVTTNPEDAAITTSIILMGKSLKLRVVAEGVETQSQLAFLRVLECDEAQGYLFGRPMPGGEAQALLARGTLTPVP